jgi:hypothetical protein
MKVPLPEESGPARAAARLRITDDHAGGAATLAPTLKAG